MAETLGVYLAVPFCKAKCTFCNFASDAFPAQRMDAYVDQLASEMQSIGHFAAERGWTVPGEVESVYFGGGTPSLLSADHFDRIFTTLRERWHILPDAEITVECAPGQIAGTTLDAMLRSGVTRISMGVQSFSDEETSAIGRFHTRASTLQEIARLRARGVTNLGIDLICGLPRQTHASWRETLELAASSDLDHVSVYMFEVDEDSRLGAEVLTRGIRYGASLVPHDEAVAEMYLEACEVLERAGIHQYEISNFARDGMQSRHNRRYWTRDPYLGFGLDAHSMLRRAEGAAVRFANTDDFDQYLNTFGPDEVREVSEREAFEESVFLGLRLIQGLGLHALASQFGADTVSALTSRIDDLCREALMVSDGNHARLTARGRLISSSVFGELLAVPA